MSSQVIESAPVEPAGEPEPAPPADSTRPSPPTPADPGRPWLRAFIVGGGTWLAAAGTYLLVTMLSWMIQELPGPAMSRLYQAWDHWDTGYYMRISRIGYTADRPDTHAFFPFYPILLRFVDTVVPGPTLVATLVLANLCCFGALVMLHRFVDREFNSTLADRTLLYLMAFPTAFFLCAGYNESLFLLLTVSALYCLRSRSYWAAGALGALASATRLTGALLVLPFALEYARQHGWRPPTGRLTGWGLNNWPPRTWPPSSWPPLTWRRGTVSLTPGRRGTVRPDLAAILLLPLGVAAFAVFCWVRFGDPLAFVHAQRLWGRHLTMPWGSFAEAWHIVTLQPMVLYQAGLHNLIDMGFALAAVVLLALSVVGPWRLRTDQLFLVAFSGTALLTILTGPNGDLFPMMGAPRYAIELIPAFILLAKLGASRVFERLYLLPAIGLQAVFLLTFLGNVWIA